MPRVQTLDCRTGRPGRRVLVVGDSITVFTAGPLAKALRGAGWSVCLDARRSQATADALDYFRTTSAFPPYVDVVVMATGSNDIFDPAVMTAQVARARRYAGTRPVVWVTTWVHRTIGHPALVSHDLRNSVRVNAAERRVVAASPRTALVDWYSFLQAKPGRASAYLVDGVHPSTRGAAARNALIVAALARLCR